MAYQTRIGGIDFLRGIVLVAIMIDHVPGNILEGLTPRNFALSDSAEAFVFLSGLSVGSAYYRKTLVSGLLPVTRSCLTRAVRIYGLHVGLTICAIAIFGLCYWLSGFATLIEAHGRTVVFHEPVRGAIGVALLSHRNCSRRPLSALKTARFRGRNFGCGADANMSQPMDDSAA